MTTELHEPGNIDRNQQSVPATLLGRVGVYIGRALRYWEPKRLIYNAVLLIVVVIHFVIALPDAWDQVSFDLGLILFFFAVLANLFYCAAYLGDLFLQLSGWEQGLRLGRIVLLTVGTAFAATIARFFSMGLFQE